ncbi:MAG: hypothetical protein KAW56_07865 [Candidatus Marinimicrobia bacterium]|nr:hypothetical protein [Candidatus Neomarinimicrobiota bacterium]
MNKQSIEVLNAVLNYNEVHDNYDKRLVIIEPKEAITGRGSKPGIFVSFDNLTAEDFFEIWRYKKSLEEDNNKKGVK